MKKLRRLRKFIVGAVSVFLIGIVALSLVSKFVYHRSLMATCSEIFLRVVDRNSMYCDEVKCGVNIAEKTVTNLQDTKPTKKMKVSVETTHEHGMQIFYINKESENNGVLFYLHGGAYLNEPASQHWGFWEKLALEADIEIIVPIYFKCTNYTCQQAYDAMLDFYLDTVEKYEGKKIYIGGENAGKDIILKIVYSRDGSNLNNGNMVPLTVDSNGYVEVYSADAYGYYPDNAYIELYDSSSNLISITPLGLSIYFTLLLIILLITFFSCSGSAMTIVPGSARLE